MKNKLFLCAAVITACAFSMEVQAQLEVTANGNVTVSKNLDVADTLTVGDNFRVTDYLVLGRNLRATNNLTVQKNMTVSQNVAIGTNLDDHTFLNLEYACPTGSPQNAYYGIKSHITPPTIIPTSPVYGIYGFADASSSTSLVPDLPLVGVMGVAFKTYSAPTTFAAGIVGMAHFYGGIGVYGGISASPTTAPSSMASGEKYAGYFSGTTKVNGTLLTNMLVLNGDTINVNNARSIPADAANSLTQLHPVSYSFKPDSTLKYDEKLQREMEGTHYGLIAQDVQKVLPELVYEREGSLSINYIEMIPLLIMKVQELCQEVDELKGQVERSQIDKKK